MRRGRAGWLAVAASCLPLAGLGGLVQAAEPAGLEAQREAFQDAYARAEAGEPAPAGGDAGTLASYPLYPYLQAARLRQALGRTGDAPAQAAVDREAAAFLTRHGDEPVARLLRGPWLSELAARRQWQAFLDAYAEARSPGQALRCQAIEARLALGRSDGVVDDAVAEWLTPRSADAACDVAFDWLRAQGRLGPDLVEQRARLALQAGEPALAKWLARSLPAATAAPLLQWAGLLDSPAASIDALLRAPATAVEDEALLAGWTRLARRDPLAARDRFETLLAARGAGAAETSRLALPLALGLAWSRHGRAALEQFARVAPGDFDEVAHEWQVRAALWTGDWPRAAAAIAAMPAALADTPRWRYWAARAAAAAGDDKRAAALYAAVVPTDNWYAVLAAARLGQAFAPRQQSLTFDEDRVAALEQRPPFLRARELFALGMVGFAQSEWNAGYAALDAGEQRSAIALADRWGWHFLTIATAAQQRLFEDYQLLYPRPFDAEVAEAARLAGVSPSLVYAVLRQESLYQSWAVSSAGAVGLMQLLPTTARATAGRMHRPRPSRQALMQPQVNLPLGAGTLASLVDRFDGQVLVALAGYNAGPGAARRWLPDGPMDADAWVENIPYNETRAYVQRVMWHSLVFQWLEDREPEQAGAWLVKVRPVG